MLSHLTKLVSVGYWRLRFEHVAAMSLPFLAFSVLAWPNQTCLDHLDHCPMGNLLILFLFSKKALNVCAFAACVTQNGRVQNQK